MTEHSQPAQLSTDPNDMRARQLGAEPASPTEETRRNSYGDISERTTVPGLTKRELFAAMAMQGQCANSIPGSHHSFENTARDAVQYADALLKELAK